ncbi:MAG: ABC transporter substrate-binding protein [Firmicutes bacterium]|nr:ABC transporter substrate-binding protein [Bacillota bacterium]
MKKIIALLLAVFMLMSMAACSSNTDPTETSGTSANTEATDAGTEATDAVEISGYTEAPYITELGIYGDVTDRLPVEEDIMVEDADYLEIGTYGGELKTSTSVSPWTTGKIIEEGLFRFTSEGIVEPNVAKGYDVNDDATVFTIYLREGMKWSDGVDFTAEDCVWFYNTILLNNVDTKGVRDCNTSSDGTYAVVEKVDDYTFTVTFSEPKYSFIEDLEVELKWYYAPKHIFEDYANYVIEYNNATDDTAKAEAESKALAEAEAICGVKFADVASSGKEMLYYFWNYSGIPTLNSYVLSTESGKNDVSGDYYEYVRNPYYWRVDAAGQQLPYIDKIVYTTIQNTDQSLLLLLDGTVDYQIVSMDAIATIRTEANVDINIYEWSGSSWGDVGTQIMWNLSIADEHLNALFNNSAFRQAMSICVNREEFASIYSEGWLSGGQATPSEGMLGYSEEWATKWTEYDPDYAKELLESCGLVMGSDGYYDFEDGTDFVLNIVSVADSGAADTYGILKPYYDAVGIKTTFRDYDRSNIDNMMLANEIECTLYPVTGIGDVSVILKPNSVVPGTATNVVWYGNLTADTATGDLLELINLKAQLDVTSDTDERTEIALKMLALHEENMWVISYVEASPTYFAVNARIHNFPEEGVFSDIYRDTGLAHCWCWYIEE